MAKRDNGLSFYRRKKKISPAMIREVFSWVFGIVAAVFIAAVLVFFFGMTTRVVGVSMEPTLGNGQQIFVDRFLYVLSSPKRGDVIVFLPNGNENAHYYVKRVIAVPGDTVLIQNGAVYVNGELFEEEVEVNAIEEAGLAAEEITLGDDEYFVLGDNRNNSEDSRYANIGNIKKEYIIGKAWFRAAPLGKFGFL